MSWVDADVEADVVEEAPVWIGCFMGVGVGAGASVTGGACAGVGAGDPIDAVSGDWW